MMANRPTNRIRKSLLFLSLVLTCVLLTKIFCETRDSGARLGEILLTKPVLAQKATAFPTDEAGISAYVNTGESIELDKAKDALRGIEAEGDNYVIGIMELPGLPEEEYPHMYVSSYGWIVAYYSKFTPSVRIIHWGKYSEGSIITTLQDAIDSLYTAVGIDYQSSPSYYHFACPYATKMTIAVDTTTTSDEFNYSIPSGVTLYEGSWSYTGEGKTDYIHYFGGPRIDDSSEIYFEPSQIEAVFLKSHETTPGILHTIDLRFSRGTGWIGAAIAFIYR